MKAYSETEGDFLATRYVIVMMFLVLGTTFAAWTQGDGVPYALLMIDSRSATGKVLHVEEKRGYKKVVYNFVDGDGGGRQGERKFDKDLPVQFEPGQSITVDFFPLFPDVAEPRMLLRYLKPGFVIMTIGGTAALCAALGSIFIVLGWMKRQQDALHY